MQFKIGDTVRKTKGSKWQGKIVGQYSTELTPNGYAVESDTETGSVQIYPASALELAVSMPTTSRADELIACLEGEVKSRDAKINTLRQSMLMDAKTIGAKDARIAELERYEHAFNEWHDKTEWVQAESLSLSAKYLGCHRADVMRDIIDQLRAELAEIKAQVLVDNRSIAPSVKCIAEHLGYTDADIDSYELMRLDAIWRAPVAKQVVMPELIEKLRAIAIRERMFRIEETYTTPEISDSISLLNNEMEEVARLNAADQEGGQDE